MCGNASIFMLRAYSPRMALGSPVGQKVHIGGLRKEFTVRGRTFEALAPIDLEVRAGEFVAIVGPSGCGKTTLLRILAGLERSSGGAFAVDRERGSTRPLNAMVFQEQSIFPWMSVVDNVAFGLKARGMARSSRRQAVLPMIRTVGLTGFEDALPHQLSGGMKQRVSLARAFAMDPELLLMDEPFAALDEQTKLLLQAELLRIWEGTRKTVLYVTHSIDDAIVLGARIGVLSGRPCRILDTIAVTTVFPRPRAVASVRSSPQYGELFGRIWLHLRGAAADPLS